MKRFALVFSFIMLAALLFAGSALAADECEHWRNCGDVICAVCEEAYAGDNVAHPYDETAYEADDTKHWHVCTECGAKLFEEEHVRSCKGNECLICTRGYTGDNVEHNCDETAFEHNEDGHWNVCADCGVEVNAENHARQCDQSVCETCGAAYTGDFVVHEQSEAYTTDATSHWYTCANCDEHLEEDLHLRDCDKAVCSTCGAAYTGDNTSHTIDETAFEFDGDLHWNVCETCGTPWEQENHWRNCNETVCAQCGAAYIGEDVQHNYQWSNPQSDADHHWYVCADCGDIIGKSGHVRNCDEEICYVCHAAYTGNRVCHGYDEDSLKYDKDKHWYVCPDCDSIYDECAHYRYCGEDTCMTCGQSYTGNNTEHDFDWSAYESDANNHWVVCADCGAVEGKAPHVRSCTGDECIECGAAFTGTAVEHDYMSDDYQGDQQMHWLLCSDCGETFCKEPHWRLCGEDVCACCGLPYSGDNVSHNYEWDVYYTNNVNHWHVCEDCGDVIDLEEHVRNCGDEVCVICYADYSGSEVQHNCSDYDYAADADYHWQVCLDCGGTIGKTAHTRHCDEEVCSDCGKAYTGNNVNHTLHWSDWQTSDVQHWHTCSTCGQQVDKNLHSSSCAAPGVCEECGADYTGGNQDHDFEADASKYTENMHTLVCSHCGETVTAQHVRSCDEAICMECGAAYDGNNISHDTGSDWLSDSTCHWQVCNDCGAIVHKGSHYNDCTDDTVCAACGVEYTDFEPSHNFDFANAEKDEVASYPVCLDCGYQEMFEHFRSCDGGEVCVTCGAPYTGDNISHEVNWDDWKHSDTHHWHYCYSCGQNVEQYEHVRTCDGSVCLECGVAYQGDNVEHYVSEILSDEIYHWYVCDICEEEVYKNRHFDCGDGICYCGESAKLAIVEQPENAYALDGEQAEVTIKAAGEEVTYTWYIKAVGTEEFKVSSITESTYAVTMNEKRDGNQLYCVVKDLYGNIVTSDTVTIRLKEELAITQQPVSAEVADGENAEATVEAEGTGLAYAWYAKAPGEAEFALTDKDDVTYTLRMNSEANGTQVYCEVTDASGEKVTSDTVTLSMKGGLAIVTQPESVRVAEDTKATVTVEAVGEELTYTWYVKSRTDTAFKKSSTTTATYSVTMNEARDGNKLYCVVADKAGNEVVTDTVVISMKVPLAITKQPTSVKAEEGEDVEVSLQAEGDELTYAWYKKNAGESRFTLTDVTGDTYTLCMEEYYNGTQLYCVVTDAYEKTLQSKTVTLSMTGALVIVTQPVHVAVDEGKDASTTVEALGDNLTYAWYVRAVGGTSFRLSGITSKTYTVEMAEERDGIQAYCIITDANGQTVQTDTVTLSMNKPKLVITQQPESTFVKEGEKVSVAVKATGTGLTYTWYVQPAGSDGFTKSSITSATYTTTMTEARDGNLLYCIVSDENGQKLQTDTVMIGIEPSGLAIVTQPETVTVEEGEMATVTVEAVGDDLTYTWYVRNAGATAFAKSSITDNVYSVTMTKARSGNQLYCVVTDGDGNTVTSDTVSINMVMSGLEIVQQPESVQVKLNEKATVSVNVAGEGLSYMWFVKSADDDTFTASSTTASTYSVTMTESRDGNRLYCVVTDKNGNSITTDTVTISMIRTELAITKEPVSVEVGLNETATLTVEATGDQLTYAWYVQTTEDGAFVKSSITTSTYSVVMTESRDGNKAYCVVTDVYGDSLKSEVATLTKTPVQLTITKQPEPVCVDKGEVATVKVEAQGDGLTYAWYQMGPGESTYTKTADTDDTYSLTMHEARNGSRVYCVVTDKRGVSVRSNTVVLSMVTPVVIILQPDSVTVPKGEKATVTVTATGEELSYAWYVKSVGTSEFKLSTITGDTYSVTMSAERDGNQLYCVVTDKNGFSVTSEIATISMTKSVEITEQPVSVTVAEGEKASVTVTATGEGLTYTWYVKSVGAAAFVKSSVSTSTYAVTMTEARNGNQLYCIVKDATGATVQSDTVTISMQPSVVITTQPVSVDVELGEQATVKVEAVGDGLTYVWYVKSVGSSVFTQSSVTGDTYSVKMTEARNGNQLYCIVSDKTGTSVKSDTVTISITPAVVITTQPVSTYVEKGQRVNLLVEAEGEDLTYAWYVQSVGTTVFNKSSVTGNTYSVTMTNARNGNQLYCVVSDSKGNLVKSDTVTIGIATDLAISTQPASVTVAKDDQAIVSVEAVGNDLTYAWYVKAPGSEAFVKSAVTTKEYAVTMTADHNGEQVYCVVTDGTGATVTSKTATLTMKAEIVITQQPISVSVASGSKATVTVKATGSDLSYVWYVKAAGTSEFNLSSITGSTYSVTMTNARNGNQLYCIISDSKGNTVKSNTVTISLLSSAVITKQPESATVTNGTAVTATVEAMGEGLTYTWYLKEAGSDTFSQTNVTTNTYTATMNAANNGMQLYCLVTGSNGSSVRSDTVTFSMKESGLAITKQPAAVEVDQNEKATVTVVATGEGLTYTWYVRAAGSDSFAKSSVTGSTYSVTMTEARDGNQVYCVVSDTYGNTVKSNTVTISMTPITLAITKQPTADSAASGEKVTVTVEATGVGLSYSWYVKAKDATAFTKSSTTGDTYSVTMNEDRDGNQVYCVVTDSYGNSVTSQAVSITLKQAALVITKHPGSVTVAEGEKATVSVTASGDGLAYTWYVKSVGASSFTKSSITGSTYSVTMTEARDGNQVYCVVTDSYDNSVKSNTATLSMQPTLKITSQPKSVEVDDGSKATVTISAIGEGLTYTWYVKSVDSGSFTKSSVTGTTYSVTMKESRDGNKVYCVVTDTYGNKVTSKTATLSLTKVTLEITAQPQSVTVPAGSKATVSVRATGEDLTYVWYVKPVGASDYSKSSITGRTYSVTMNENRNGNKLFCVIYDGNGNKVTSNSATISME